MKFVYFCKNIKKSIMKFKTQLLTIITVFAFPIILFGQQEIVVFEDSASISKGKHLGFAVNIPESDFDNIKKEWSKLIRQNTKSKVEEEGLELSIMNTQIEEIHHEPINLYSAIFKKDSSIKVIAFYEIDSSFFTFTESNKTLQGEKTYHGIRHFMRNFAIEQYKYVVQQDLDEEEKTLKKLNKEFENLAKENENSHKEIQENEQKIENSEDAITTYESDNDRKLNEIDAKKEDIASLAGDSELSKKAKDQLKALEKEKGNIENKLEKEKKNIVKYNANIDEMNHLIEDNLEKQEEMKIEIEKQEDIVKMVSTKLRGIN